MLHPASCARLLHRIGEQFRLAHIGFGQLMDKARIRAVLKQAANQISQQIAVPAHRRIDAAAIAALAHQVLVQPVAHAVQPLEFEGVVALAQRARPVDDRRDGARVVAGECGLDMRADQQFARTSQVRHVGVDLAREQRIIGQALFLRRLDLAVPVGALDQPHAHRAPRRRPQSIGPAAHCGGALRISLHRHAQAIPLGQRRIGGHLRNQIEAEVEPLAFFGIHGQRDVCRRRRPRETVQAVGQCRQAAIGLRSFVARMQRRKLDRNRMARFCGTPHRRDRAVIRFEIAACVLVRARAFAQHVEAGGEALAVAVAHAGDGFVDGAAHHEGLAHQPHRRAHRLTHERFATARDQPAEHPRLRLCPNHRAAQHQPPGGRIDQHRR